MIEDKDKNLLPEKRNKSTVDIVRNDQTTKTVKLGHMFELSRRCRGVRSVNVTPDNRYLIITFEYGTETIRVLDLKKVEFLPHHYAGHSSSVRLTSIGKNSKIFYTASWDGTSRRFELISGKCTQILSGIGRSPSCFLEPEQRYLFTASYDSDHDLDSKNTGRCWDISSGRSIHIYKHTNERDHPESIDIAYDNVNVYTGSDDGIAYKWNLQGGKPIFKFFTFHGSVRKVAVTTKYFAAACTDGLVRVHNKFSGEYFRYLLHGKTDVRDVRISKDEKKLWSAGEDGSIACFDLITGELIYHQRPHSSWIWSMCLMNDEKTLITGSRDGSIAFLSADTGQIIARLFNLPNRSDLLIVCPRDTTFPTGFFYTTNDKFIQVIYNEKEGSAFEKLNLSDPRRKSYISKHNLKHLVITRLNNNEYYRSLTEKYIQDQKLLKLSSHQKSQLLLKV